MSGGMIALRKELKEKYVIKNSFSHPSNNRVFFVPLFGRSLVIFWHYGKLIFVMPIK